MILWFRAMYNSWSKNMHFFIKPLQFHKVILNVAPSEDLKKKKKIQYLWKDIHCILLDFGWMLVCGGTYKYLLYIVLSRLYVRVHDNKKK